jgi:hypothetical protein
MTDTESPIWAYLRPLDRDRPLWRAGRALWRRRRGGRTNPRNGHRWDLELGAEWSLLTRGHGLGWQLKVGTAGSERDLALALYASRLGSLWLHTSGLLPEHWLVPGYESRVVGAQLHATDSTGHWDHAKARIQIWAPRDSWSRDAPWHRTEHTIGISNLLGRAHHTTSIVDDGVCTVPMPERNYPATYETTRHVTTWPTRLGRLRPARVTYSTKVTPGVPIPVPGKGENSWDLDDDAIHSSSSGGRSVTDAIASLVSSALAKRERYGGQHMSAPADTTGGTRG